MINIIVDSKRLILNPDTVIKLELVFPDPTQDNLPSSVVQWFNIRAIKQNDEIFNFAKYIEVSNKIRIYENTILEAFGISKKGTLIVKTATRGEYKVSISFNPFPSGFKDMLLQSLDLAQYNIGNDTDTIIANAKSNTQLEYPNTDFAFPMVKMGNFYGPDINEYFLHFINYYQSLSSSYQKNIESTPSVSGNINCLVPFFYLLSAIEGIFAEANFNVNGKLFDDVDIKKLIVFNNFGIDKLRNDYVVKAFTDTTHSQSDDTVKEHLMVFDDEEDTDNVFNLAAATYTANTSGLHVFDISIYIYLTAYSGDPNQNLFKFGINSDGDDFNYEYESTLWGIPGGDWVYITYRFEIDVSITDIGKTFTFYINSDNTFYFKNLLLYINPYAHNMLNIYDGNIKMQNHLPNISVSEFINNIVKLYSLAIFADDNNLEFTFWKDILNNNKYLDLTEQYIKDTDEVEIYKEIYSLKMPFNDDEIDKRIVEGFPVIDNVYKNDLPNPTRENQIYYIKDLNRYVISYFDVDDFKYIWQPYRDNFKDINSEVSDAKDIDIKVNTLQMHLENYPQSMLTGSSPVFAIGKNEFPFKLLFNHGFNINEKYGDMPYASSSQHLPNGTTDGSHTLRLNDADGVYEKYSKPYYDYVTEQDVNTVMLNINEKDLHDILKLFAPGNDTRKVRIVNRNYIPIRFDIEIGMSNIKSCKAKLR